MADIEVAEMLVFPGVGAYGQAIDILKKRGYTQAREGGLLHPHV